MFRDYQSHLKGQAMQEEEEEDDDEEDSLTLEDETDR
jgi:hypothetical protein